MTTFSRTHKLTLSPSRNMKDETDTRAATLARGPEAQWQDVPLDRDGRRRAQPRFQLADGVTVMLDLHSATLIDLSIVGAQVLSPVILQPTQRVRLALGENRQDIRCDATVVWSLYELTAAGRRYRAGLEFFNADPKAIENFYIANKKTATQVGTVTKKR